MQEAQDKISVSFWSGLYKYRVAIMGLSMIFIILFHQPFVSTFPAGVFHNCGYWGVDVFLLLSGTGMVNSLNKNSLLSFYKRRFVRIIPTCILCGILKCSMKIILEGKSAVEDIGLCEIFGLDLWFIHAILFYYAISPILFTAIKKKGMLIILLIAAIYFVNGFFFRVHDSSSFTWIIERLLVFSLGMYWGINKDQITNKTINISLISLCAAFFIIIIKKKPVGNPEIWTILMFLVAFGTISILQISMSLLKKCPITILRAFEFFGKLSLELYLLHEFLFKFAITHYKDYYSPLVFLSCILLSLIISYICQLSTNSIIKTSH